MADLTVTGCLPCFQAGRSRWWPRRWFLIAWVIVTTLVLIAALQTAAVLALLFAVTGEILGIAAASAIRKARHTVVEVRQHASQLIYPSDPPGVPRACGRCVRRQDAIAYGAAG